MGVPDRYNVATVLDRNLEAGRGSKVAIYCGEDRLSYSELYAQVCRMGHALKHLGVRREERVLLILSDTPAFPIAFLGAIRIGAVPVPVNPLFKTEDYRYFLEDTNARVLVADPPHLDKVTAALARYPEPVTVITTAGSAPGTLTLANLLSGQPDDLPPAATHQDDMAFWLYSSGSTGRPKGVVHLHHDIPYTCETYARHVLEISEDDVAFSKVLFHAYGLGNALSFPFWVGAGTVLYPDRSTPAGILGTVERFRPSLLFSVPTVYNAILNDAASTGYDLSSVRLCISAAEPLPPDTWRRWKERYGLTILDGIGSTEMLHIFCSNRADAVRPGSSGTPVPGYELDVVDEAGRPVAPGGTGHLLVKGDSAAPLYWHQYARSKQTMRGEWLATGDRYRVDQDGYYWYEGRADDMMKIGGEWVSPIEIENALLEHAAVQEVAVVGVPVDGIMRIKAVVVSAPGPVASQQLVSELQVWCKTRLHRYKYPHVVEFQAELPKTATGKIQRFKLR